MKKFVFLLASVLLIQAAWGLKCKRCKDKGDPTCKELVDDTCGSQTGKEAACLRFIYKDGDKEFTERMCVEKFKEKKFECVPTKTSDVIVECETCMTDFCNTASKVNIGLLSVVAAVVALVAPRVL